MIIDIMVKDPNGITHPITLMENQIMNKNIIKINFSDKMNNLNINNKIEKIIIIEILDLECLMMDFLNLHLKEHKKYSKKLLEQMNFLMLDFLIFKCFPILSPKIKIESK